MKVSTKKLTSALLPLVLATFTSISLLAQTDRGIITGTVKDASGAVLPGAQVTVLHQSTQASFKTTTTASGDFTIPSLAVGVYQLKVEIAGFKLHVQDHVEVRAAPPDASM